MFGSGCARSSGRFATNGCDDHHRGYDADAIRAGLMSRKHPGHPGRSNRRVKIEHDWALYKQRNCIVRMFGRLKIIRAIAARSDRLAASFMSMVDIATARYWLKIRQRRLDAALPPNRRIRSRRPEECCS